MNSNELLVSITKWCGWREQHAGEIALEIHFQKQ